MSRPAHTVGCASDEHDEDGVRYVCDCGFEPKPTNPPPRNWQVSVLNMSGDDLQSNHNVGDGAPPVTILNGWEPFAYDSVGGLTLIRRLEPQ